ncbi:MmgE/PrpD family protein [Gordonia sp. TBRC 11910]|uniref:MmgE/PrpD family protein n=1 Tax=Gordonia asplenii TaxID=2725283 RepID=A0A848KZ45_9ACTN|nr:MmgE/PrpD family protein [Gordonia asplenii]NMO03994.1 MmgE/PrpD family protein [Gordonia asplenii]
MTAPTIEQAAAALVTDLTYDAISPEALAGTRRLMEDQLALQVGCSSLPWCRAVLDLTRASHAPGVSSVTAGADKFSAADAAFVNATYGHSFEYDDAHSASLSHPGSAVVSAAIAVGEEIGATVEEVLVGIVAGYEIYTRIGTLAAPMLLQNGFHPHAVLAPFGAAAVVAKMKGFDAETTLHALSIALSHSAGTTEYTSSGGSIKRIHSGIGTRNGIRAAEMAAAGITGPTRFLAGNKGFFNTFVRRELTDADVDRFSLNRPFEIAGPLFKPYCACGYNHAFIDGARTFADRIADIEKVELAIQPSGDVVVGNKNVSAWAPQKIEQLQYALPFQFALSALRVGNGYQVHKAYLDGRLDLGPDSEVAALAQKISIRPEPELDKEYGRKMVGDITVTFADGATEHLFVEDSTGSAANPMSEADLDAKYRDLAVGELGDARADELLAAIKGAPLDTPATAFAALLRR